ncbi:MAG: Transketolase 1 [Phycisphaerae bacterium]|nr:Transketolase 1 [Phycisphaerae bacterium]
MSSAAAVGALHRKAATLGKFVVRMTASAGAGHPSSALSLAHLTAHLMYRQMRWDPGNPWHPTADRLVLSEGHAVPIIYAALADLGATVGRSREQSVALHAADLDQLRALDSVLDGHPNPAEGVPFFDAATGSLGQGLSVAAGLALAARLDGSPRRVFAIVGDGESREGQVWEAVDFIVDHKLNHVCAVFNCNGQGQAGLVSQQQSAERLSAKLEAFGWKVTTIDGHDPGAIEQAFARVGESERPLAVVARTVKGWGAEQLRKGNWHGKPPKKDDLPAIERSIDQTVAPYAAAEELPRPRVPAEPRSAPQRGDPRGLAWPPFADAMSAAGFGAAVAANALGTRKAYGAALRAAGAILPQLVVLDADVSNSTFSELFAAAYPQRFFECKIGEQNMASVAVGLSAGGLIPVCNTFAKFWSRALDQIELAAISRANIKLVGSHAGITPHSDGPSQMGLCDVAFFRSLSTVPADDRESPLGWFFQPSDAVSAFHCTRLMLEARGLCYMRTHRPDAPLLYAPDTRFEAGGFHVRGAGEHLALVASGYMVHVAAAAADLLGRHGVRATLIDAYSLPIRSAALTHAVVRAGGKAVVVEDNYGGGLGAAVAEIAAASGKFRACCASVRRIPKSTVREDEILTYCGLSAQQIADDCLGLLERKGAE